MYILVWLFCFNSSDKNGFKCTREPHRICAFSKYFLWFGRCGILYSGLVEPSPLCRWPVIKFKEVIRVVQPWKSITSASLLSLNWCLHFYCYLYRYLPTLLSITVFREANCNSLFLVFSLRSTEPGHPFTAHLCPVKPLALSSWDTAITVQRCFCQSAQGAGGYSS